MAKKLTYAELEKANGVLTKRVSVLEDSLESVRNTEYRQRVKLKDCKEYIKWIKQRLSIKDSVIVVLSEQLHDYSRLSDMDNDPHEPDFDHFDPSE